AQIWVSAGTNWTIDYNDYYDTSGGGKVGQWGTSGTVLNFANWKTNSGGDAHAINSNPLFVSLTLGSQDFHLQSGSPAKNVGENGVDMGAYPAGGTSALPSSPLAAPTAISVN